MKKSIRKLLAVFCAALIVLTSIPLPFTGNTVFADTSASSAEFLGLDTTTKGAWEGVHGGDGYILFGYNQASGFGGTEENTSFTIKDSDHVQSPVYMTSYANNFQWGGNYWTDGAAAANDNADAGVLNKPSSSSNQDKKEMYASSCDSDHSKDITEWTFTLNDENEHTFSFYAYKGQQVESVQILDLNDQVLTERSFDAGTFTNGAYACYKVKGSFKLRIQVIPGWGVSGFFFDAPAPAAPVTSASFIGTDNTTQGHWNNHYGSDGYILIGYKGRGTGGYYDVMNSDLVSKPSYLTDYTMGPNLLGGGYWTDGGVDNGNASILDKPAVLPEGVSTDKYIVYVSRQDAYDYTEFTFNLKDDQEHIFSFYSNKTVCNGQTMQTDIRDLNDNVLDTRQINKDTFQNGCYVTYSVKGSFKLRIKTAPAFGIEGFFFDAPVSDTASGVSAAVYQKSQVKVAWTNQGSPENVLIERSTDNVNFERIAKVSGASTEYTDNVITGQKYYYRLRYQEGTKYGSVTAVVDVDVPAMNPTAVILQNSDLAQNIDDQIELSAKFEDVSTSEPAPLAGKTITFRLQGSHVGDGTTWGQEIPNVMGTAVTDQNGIATISYTCIYGGEYTVVATADQENDANLSGAASAPIKLTVNSPWKTAPQIIKISDAVSSGKSFTINGGGINKDTVDVAIAPDTDGQSPAVPPAGVQHPEIVQTDKDGNYVVAKMPDGAIPGVYNVWVKNEFGWSAPYKMNEARASFMSEYQAFKGLDIGLVGRNLDQSEFGGTTETKVRLNDGSGKIYEMSIKSLNPYKVTFSIGDQSLGSYFVEVSNDNGKNWARLDNGQKLEIIQIGSDPLGLGVAWSKDFKWNNQLDVTGYGANPNDTNDDTAAVQAAVDAAEANGGGVVYFQNGSYYISKINLGAGVVLEGQDEFKTKLYYTGAGSNFVDTKGNSSLGGVAELQGVARLSLLLSDSDIRPDAFIDLGQPWSDAFFDMSLRNANRLFCVNVNIDYPFDNPGKVDSNGNRATGRGIGILFIGKERVLINNNRFVGWGANNLITAMSQYFTENNNYFEYATGYVHGMSSYSFYENNFIKIHPEFNQDSHGIFTRDNAYAANNTVIGAGSGANDTNDGEGISCEPPGGGFNYGQVLKADSTSITVAPLQSLTFPAMAYSKLSIIINNGRGLGQLRRVVDIDAATNKIILDKPFDIIPDSSSKFTLVTPNDNFTVYNNTLINNAKGIWPFGNTYDDVIADNTTIDCRGIYLWSVSGGGGSPGMDWPSYFVRITRNTVTGVSRRGNKAGIGLDTGRWDNNGKLYQVAIYSTEITDNTITGNNVIPFANEVIGGGEIPRLSGIYLMSYGFSTLSDGSGTGDITNTIIEDNKLSNLETGVTITECNYGQVVINNTYDNSVLQYLDNRTGESDNTLVANNQTLDKPAYAVAEISVNVPATVHPGDSVVISAKLTSGTQYVSGDTAVQGKSLTFKVNGEVAGTATTSEDGIAAITYTAGLLPKNYNVTVDFAKDDVDQLNAAHGVAGLYVSIASDTASADKTSLTEAIAAANTLLAGKTVGTAGGNVPQAAKDTYQTAIDAAVAVNDNSAATQAEIDAQVAALTAAATAFNNAVIASAPVSSNPGTQTPTQGQGQTTDQVPGIITVKPALNGKTAEAKVEASALEKAFNEVVKDLDGVKTVTIKVPAVINASGYYQQLPADIFTHSKTNGADVSKRIEINTPIGTVVIPDNMFKANDINKADNVGFSIAAADLSRLGKQELERIGSKPVIELNASVDGKKIAWKNADAPVIISVDYKPTAEELKNPECITVWYIDGNGKVNSVPSGRYDAATGKVTFATTHFSTYAVAYNYKTFNDTGKYNWAQRQIGFVAAKGIIDGTSETIFSPGENITRAQFLDALVKALGLSAEFESNFSDIKITAYYYETLGIARKLGITSGTGNNKFSPDAQISRQEMATLVVRAMKIAGKLNTGGTASDLKKYTDASKIAKYAAESMAELVKEGILQGADNKLNPSGKLTRAEAAVVLYNIYKIG